MSHSNSSPIMLSSVMFFFLSLPIFWTVTSSHCAFSSITRPYCPGHLKAFPHSISLLHLCPSRCFLVIFCVVCFGCSSVSHHSPLMTGCFLTCQCCFSRSQSLSPRHTILLPFNLYTCTGGGAGGRLIPSIMSKLPKTQTGMDG